jgi:hypothetical protein
MKLIIISILSLVINVTFAGNNESLTLDYLIKNNYQLMSAAEINKIISGKKVILKDLLSKAVYELKIDKSGMTEKKTISEKSPDSITSVEYSSRADLLSGDVKLSVKGNNIVITDGIRTYISNLYKKEDNIYVVRDVDNSKVSFKIIIKSLDK